MSDSKIEAERKIRKALEKIEMAQRLLSDACAELCPIDGFVREWDHVGNLYDKVKAGWHKVNNRLNGGKFDLDSDAKRRFEERQAAS